MMILAPFQYVSNATPGTVWSLAILYLVTFVIQFDLDWWYSNGNGGGDFFLACKAFGRMFNHSFPICAFFFFLSGECSRMLISLFMPGSINGDS